MLILVLIVTLIQFVDNAEEQTHSYSICSSYYCFAHISISGAFATRISWCAFAKRMSWCAFATRIFWCAYCNCAYCNGAYCHCAYSVAHIALRSLRCAYHFVALIIALQEKRFPCRNAFRTLWQKCMRFCLLRGFYDPIGSKTQAVLRF